MTVSTWVAGGNPQGSFSAFDADWTLLDMKQVSGLSGGAEAVAVAAVATDGAVQVRVIDTSNGAAISTRDFATPADTFHQLLASGSELGTVLGDAANVVSLELQTAEGEPGTRAVTAVSMAPPPTGGGSFGWLLTPLLAAALLRRRRRRRRLRR